MNRSDATIIVAKLVAAFPHPRVPPETVALYVEELSELPHVGAARAAVDDLLHSERFWPPLAAIFDGYYDSLKRIRDREASERGLAERASEPDARSREQAWAAIKQLEGREGPFAASVRETLIRLANGQTLADQAPRVRHLEALRDAEPPPDEAQR
jgi:hypothetical protein